MEEVLVGDRQANGSTQNAVKDGQGQFRVINESPESRCGRRVDGEDQVAPWMAMHAA